MIRLAVAENANEAFSAAPDGVIGAATAAAGQPAGGTMCTMLPHFGQAWISPITSGLRIFSRERHVSQMIRKDSTNIWRPRPSRPV